MHMSAHFCFLTHRCISLLGGSDSLPDSKRQNIRVGMRGGHTEKNLSFDTHIHEHEQEFLMHITASSCVRDRNSGAFAGKF